MISVLFGILRLIAMGFGSAVFILGWAALNILWQPTPIEMDVVMAAFLVFGLAFLIQPAELRPFRLPALRALGILAVLVAIWTGLQWMMQTYNISNSTNTLLTDQIFRYYNAVNHQVGIMSSIHISGRAIPGPFWWNMGLMALSMGAGALVLAIAVRLLLESVRQLREAIVSTNKAQQYSILEVPQTQLKIGPLTVGIDLTRASTIRVPTFLIDWALSMREWLLPDTGHILAYSPSRQALVYWLTGLGLVGLAAILNIVLTPVPAWLNLILLTLLLVIFLRQTQRFTFLAARLRFHTPVSWGYIGFITLAGGLLLARIFSLGWTSNAITTILLTFPNFLMHLAVLPLQEFLALKTTSGEWFTIFVQLVMVWAGLSEIMLLLALAINVVFRPVTRSILPYMLGLPTLPPIWRKRLKGLGGLLGIAGVLAIAGFLSLLFSDSYILKISGKGLLPAINLPVKGELVVLPAIHFPVKGELVVQAILAGYGKLAPPGQAQVLFAGTNKGLFRSQDSGMTWLPLDSAGRHPVRVLAQDERSGTVFAGSAQGIEVSPDSGKSWRHLQRLKVDVLALAFNPASGTLYAGAMDGVYRSSKVLQDTLLEDLEIPGKLRTNALALDGSRALYAGTDAGIYQYQDMKGWQKIPGPPAGQEMISLMVFSPGADRLYFYGINGFGMLERVEDSWHYHALPSPEDPFEYASALVVTGENSICTGTESGVLCYDLQRDRWETLKTSDDNTNAPVYALAVDPTSRAILTGQSHGITSWYSDPLGDLETRWYPVQFESSAVMSIRGLRFDTNNDWVYAIPDLETNTPYLDARSSSLPGNPPVIIYRIQPFIEHPTWQVVGREVPGQKLYDLLVDSEKQRLYAWTDRGLFHYNEKIDDWERLGAGLENIVVSAIARNENGELLLGTDLGLFRSADNGQSWQAIGFDGENVRALVSNGRQGITAVAGEKIYRSDDQGRSWQYIQDLPAQDSAPWLDTSFLKGSCGSLIQTNSELSWASCQGDALGSIYALGFGLPQSYAVLSSDGRCTFFTTQAGTSAAVLADPGRCRQPTPQEMIAAWAKITILPRLAMPMPWLWASLNWLLPVGVIAWIREARQRYLVYTREFGIPFWLVGLWLHPRLEPYANRERVDACWPQWEKIIQEELVREGEVSQDNLPQIPIIFRASAIRRFYQEYSEKHSLELQAGFVRYPNARVLREWRMQTVLAGQEVARHGRMSPRAGRAAERLARILAMLMDFNLNQHRDGEFVRAYQIEAPSLRLKLPLRFPLIFVGAPQPDNQTVKMLVDTVDVLKEQGYFALIVPLSTPEDSRNIANKLISAIRGSAYVHDFIVLSYEDLFEILISKSRAAGLVDKVLAQVDLNIVSPFVVNGPVPTTMFFGRDAEIKNLQKNIFYSDFAIVGNRKVGKTSLLKQVQNNLAEGARPLWIDCQDVRNPAGFFRKFQNKTGIRMAALTPEDFGDAMVSFAGDGSLPVLLIDEVDNLLAYEATHDGTLLDQWRSLAHQGTCHFIFCGSRGVISQLEDSRSAFFNFPQRLQLAYLSQNIASQVLTQPLQTMGVVIEEPDLLLEEVYMLTAGHPNLIQYIGKELVEAANRRGERRILMEDLHGLRNDAEFTDNYLSTIWGAAEGLEKMITLVAPPGAFSMEDIQHELECRDVAMDEDELDLALRMLTVYSILEQNELLYQFRVHAFPEILYRTKPVESLFRIEKSRLKRTPKGENPQ